MFHPVTCPSCFQEFQIAGPAPSECPAEWDYDCEICCRPMLIAFESDPDFDGAGGDVSAEARGLDE